MTTTTDTTMRDALLERLRLLADTAADQARADRAAGRDNDAAFHTGRQSAFLTSILAVREAAGEKVVEG